MEKSSSEENLNLNNDADLLNKDDAPPPPPRDNSTPSEQEDGSTKETQAQDQDVPPPPAEDSVANTIFDQLLTNVTALCVYNNAIWPVADYLSTNIGELVKQANELSSHQEDEQTVGMLKAIIASMETILKGWIVSNGFPIQDGELKTEIEDRNLCYKVVCQQIVEIKASLTKEDQAEKEYFIRSIVENLAQIKNVLDLMIKCPLLDEAKYCTLK